MRTIFLHIGMHKTGTTSIQRAFDGYDDGTTKYADLGYENHSLAFYTAFSGMHQIYGLWQDQGLGPEEIEARKDEFTRLIVAVLEADPEKNLIFSGEDISGFPQSGVTALRGVLRRYADRITVIAYLRDPLSFVASSIQEAILRGARDSAFDIHGYEIRLQMFIDAFGERNVILRSHAREKLHDGDVVADFAHQLGLRTPDTMPAANRRLSLDATRTLYLLNKFVGSKGENPRMAEAKAKCICVLEDLLPGRFLVPGFLVANLIDPRDIEWLAENTDVDVSEWPSSVPGGTAESIAQQLDDYLSRISDYSIERIADALAQRGHPPTYEQTPENVAHRLLAAALAGDIG
jgi:hypothetical protein